MKMQSLKLIKNTIFNTYENAIFNTFENVIQF